MKDVLALTDLSRQEILQILDRADALHDLWHNRAMPDSLKGLRIALWFWGNGFRNRVAFEIGAKAMGAQVAHIPGDLGIHEPLEDMGHYLNNWFDMALVRCKSHEDLVQLAGDFNGPVINGRTNFNHPCEILGDLQYIRRIRGDIQGLKVLFVGEVTNLCRSWMEAAQVLPLQLVQVAPEDYLLPQEECGKLNSRAQGEITLSTDLDSQVDSSVDLIYTDCWPGDREKEEIRRLFLPYQITQDHLKGINPRGFFLPCPPVTRGEEVSEASLESPLCQDYQAKEFLLHSQNALMEYLV